MQVTREQRDAWAAGTRDSPFNNWLSSRTSAPDGSLDLDLLHEVAAEFGVDASRYAHLNPGQRRMNVGNRLRALVPSDVYAAPAGGHAPTHIKSNPSEALDGSKPKAPFPEEWAFLRQAKAIDLMRLQSFALDELKTRNIVRTANAPLGDYAESLFTMAFDWTLEANSRKSFDAVDAAGVRYQIKSRMLRKSTRDERQLGTIWNLADVGFDKLAAVLFDADFQVKRAAIIPRGVVIAYAKFKNHDKGWRFILDDSVWQLDGVEDVTAILRSVSLDADVTGSVGER